MNKIKQKCNEKYLHLLLAILTQMSFSLMALSREQGENFYGVTTKRLIMYKDGDYTEIPISEVVAVNPPGAKVERSAASYIPYVRLLARPQVKLGFDVVTYQGIIRFDGIAGNPANCGMFIAFINRALMEYQTGKNAYAHVLCDLKLE